MTNKEAIKYLQQLYPNGGHCWLDEQRMEAVGMAIRALQEEPVSNSDWLTELQEKLDNATPEQLEELWNKYNGVDEEEPVSEDLVEAMNRAADETRLAKAKNGQPFFSEVDFNLGFSNGAQWQKQQTIDKACEWLMGNWSHYVTVDNGIVKCYNNMIDDLMEYISEPCR